MLILYSSFSPVLSFAQHTGAGEHADELYAAVRKGMGINDNTGENDE
jgi:hypothetical protein